MDKVSFEWDDAKNIENQKSVVSLLMKHSTHSLTNIV